MIPKHPGTTFPSHSRGKRHRPLALDRVGLGRAELGQGLELGLARQELGLELGLGLDLELGVGMELRWRWRLTQALRSAKRRLRSAVRPTSVPRRGVQLSPATFPTARSCGQMCWDLGTWSVTVTCRAENKGICNRQVVRALDHTVQYT